jgi:hypothetical protein
MAPIKFIHDQPIFMGRNPINLTGKNAFFFIGGPSISSGSNVPRFHHSRASSNGGSLDFQGQ